MRSMLKVHKNKKEMKETMDQRCTRTSQLRQHPLAPTSYSFQDARKDNNDTVQYRPDL